MKAGDGGERGCGRTALFLQCRGEVLSAFLGYKEESHLVFQSDLMMIHLCL